MIQHGGLHFHFLWYCTFFGSNSCGRKRWCDFLAIFAEREQDFHSHDSVTFVKLHVPFDHRKHIHDRDDTYKIQFRRDWVVGSFLAIVFHI